jgi:hypothetical protein
MATMHSPAGDMDLRVDGVDVADGLLQIKGRLGVWDATIELTPAEVRHLVVTAPKLKLVRLLLSGARLRRPSRGQHHPVMR